MYNSLTTPKANSHEKLIMCALSHVFSVSHDTLKVLSPHLDAGLRRQGM
jgi:hypothetical protein